MVTYGFGYGTVLWVYHLVETEWAGGGGQLGQDHVKIERPFYLIYWFSIFWSNGFLFLGLMGFDKFGLIDLVYRTSFTKTYYYISNLNLS